MGVALDGLRLRRGLGQLPDHAPVLAALAADARRIWCTAVVMSIRYVQGAYARIATNNINRPAKLTSQTSVRTTGTPNAYSGT